MVSVLVPLAYVGFLVGSLYIFSKVYRKRQATKAKQAPWFPQHETRDIYVSLLSMDPPPSRPVLIAALIRRAMTDVQRIVEVRNDKMAVQTLLQKGQIGDDTWNHLLETEKELEAELMEVVGEANHFRQGWGQVIFAHASDMVQHEKHRKIFENIEKEREKARAVYSSPAPIIQAPPILGIAAANPKKRVLPSSVPPNAQVPPSKPSTPVPQSTPSAPAQALANARAKAQAQGQAQSPAQKPLRPNQTPAKVSPPVVAGLSPASTPPRSTPSPTKSPLKQVVQTEAPAAPSTASSSDNEDEAEADKPMPLSNSTNTSPEKKTPSKKKNKKKGKKK